MSRNIDRGTLFNWKAKSFSAVFEYICPILKPTKILEWGPGDSTELLLRIAPKAHILSIEHDLKYFNIALERFEQCPHVELVHKELSFAGGKSMGYINYPIWRNIREYNHIEPEYDLIFIDGRSRFDCLVSAYQLVRNNGIVILHDSHRANYLHAVDLYNHKRAFGNLRTIVASKSSLTCLDDFDRDFIPEGLT